MLHKLQVVPGPRANVRLEVRYERVQIGRLEVASDDEKVDVRLTKRQRVAPSATAEGTVSDLVAVSDLAAKQRQ